MPDKINPLRQWRYRMGANKGRTKISQAEAAELLGLHMNGYKIIERRPELDLRTALAAAALEAGINPLE